jgi:hypothetical protein
VAVEMRDTGGPANLSDPRARGGVPRHALFVTDAGTHGRALILVHKFYAAMLVECWVLTTTYLETPHVVSSKMLLPALSAVPVREIGPTASGHKG